MGRRRKLTQDKLMELRARMVKHATFKQDRFPDEIGNEYVVRLLEGLHQKATIDQAYIDIKRTQINTRSKHVNSISALEHGVSNAGALDYVEHTSTLSTDDVIRLKAVLGKIKDKRTIQIFTWYRMGWTYAEIGNELGIGEARVSQIVLRTIDKLRESIT